jgi:hypothetical protein
VLAVKVLRKLFFMAGAARLCHYRGFKCMALLDVCAVAVSTSYVLGEMSAFFPVRNYARGLFLVAVQTFVGHGDNRGRQNK